MYQGVSIKQSNSFPVCTFYPYLRLWPDPPSARSGFGFWCTLHHCSERLKMAIAIGMRMRTEPNERWPNPRRRAEMRCSI